MSLLPTLCQFSQQNPNHSAREALHLLTSRLSTQHPAQQFAHTHPQHPGHPLAMNNQVPNQFISPGNPPHLALPMTAQNSNSVSASPGTLNNMSPAIQNQMLQQNHHLTGTPQQSHQHLGQPPTSVGMVATQSQQGTNNSGGGSQGTSATASPNQTNKRRRASAVKVEGDDIGGEINGTGPAGANKVKASPRVPVKRQKGNG